MLRLVKPYTTSELPPMRDAHRSASLIFVLSTLLVTMDMIPPSGSSGLVRIDLGLLEETPQGSKRFRARRPHAPFFNSSRPRTVTAFFSSASRQSSIRLSP